ncbi:MAG TPA: response regulator [Thermoanaerobaculia bacterium]
MPRVLVVEDDEAARGLIVRLLIRNGFTADAAPDGEVAMAKLAALPYDAVVLDYMMPRADGAMVVAFIRREVPEMLARTVLCTAWVQAVANSEDLALVPYVVRKPFELPVLLSAVNACVNAARGEA